jgi:hypothetical protein
VKFQTLYFGCFMIIKLNMFRFEAERCEDDYKMK